MKQLKYLLLLLMAFLSIAAILEKWAGTNWLDPKCETIVIPVVDHCIDTGRYNLPNPVEKGGIEIDHANYDIMKAAYDGPTPPPELFIGTLISKQAIDKMFDGEPTANSLVCRMAKDNLGNGTMVYKVVRSNDFKIGPGGTGIGPYFFYSPFHCPVDCAEIP